MPKTVDNYIIQKQLFKDHFQIQYLLCEHKILKKPFLLKKIEKSIDSHSKQQEKQENIIACAYSCIQNQIRISKDLKSNKIIKCLKILKAKHAIYAVYDQHPKKTLEKMISTQYLSYEKKQTIINQIIQLIKQVHSQNVVIANLQPAFLYFTHQNKIFASNFLISRKINSNGVERIDKGLLDASCKFLAPELLKKGLMTKASDIYSLGVIIRNLNLEIEEIQSTKHQNQSLKSWIQKMTYQNHCIRPTILQVEKMFELRINRNKSTRQSNQSKEHEQYNRSSRGLCSYKSQLNLRFTNEKAEESTVIHSNSKKSLMSRREIMIPALQITKGRDLVLKSKNSLDPETGTSSSKFLSFQSPSIKESNFQNKSVKNSIVEHDSTRSLQKTGMSIVKGSVRQKIKDVIIMRNIVSFLLEMANFVYTQNSSHILSALLIQDALKYSQTIIKSLDYMIKHEALANEKIYQFFQENQREKSKIHKILSDLDMHLSLNQSFECMFSDQLKKFAKSVLNSYSYQYFITNRASSDSLSRAQHSLQQIKRKQDQEKLFKTLLLLKRLEYGNYFEFFNSKIHHFTKKFWNQHYFQFEKTFGGKYFVMQIKDLITKK